MDLTLSDNIRSLRKQRKMTQEQLAEVLGVTTGAVYKWESGLSIPELEIIVSMADFFDISVDALLGYRMKDNSLVSVSKRLSSFLSERNPDTIAEAEKALKKYPNSFDIVLSCAEIFLVLGIENHDRKLLDRSLELMDQSLILISQNTEPSISEYTIYGMMGRAYIAMDQREKGLEILKSHNTDGLFNTVIGTSLALDINESEQAETYLSVGLLQSVSSLISIVMGYALVYRSRGDYLQERDIVSWALDFINGLKATDEPNYSFKAQAYLYTLLAHTQFNLGNEKDARLYLQKAAELSHSLDSALNYSTFPLRFIIKTDDLLITDSLGRTAEESLSQLIKLLKDPNFDIMWKEINQDV